MVKVSMPNSNEYMRKYNAERYAKRRKYFESLLGGECANCSATGDDLQFDHIDPSTKEYDIAKILLGRNEKILGELKKCQLLCTDCHNKKTADENRNQVPWNKGTSIHGASHHLVYVLKCTCGKCLDYRERRNASRRKSQA